jgi:ComF family protein
MKVCRVVKILIIKGFSSRILQFSTEKTACEFNYFSKSAYLVFLVKNLPKVTPSFSTMRKQMLELIDDFLSLFYPRLCLACHQKSPIRGEYFCLSCKYHLPQTGFHERRENQFSDRFFGRVPIEAGAAMYFFRKGGLTQEVIHQLKYKGKKEIGQRLGEIYGRDLKSSPMFESVQVIVPIPLHPRKEKKRGYNQSAMFALGLSKTMGVPALVKAVSRNVHTATQTKKKVLGRLENVESIFRIANEDALAGKHVLIVDDVLTTGATLEACAEEILKIQDTRVSLATIAIATH